MNISIGGHHYGQVKRRHPATATEVSGDMRYFCSIHRLLAFASEWIYYNAPNLASSSFDKQWLILITFWHTASGHFKKMCLVNFSTFLAAAITLFIHRKAQSPLC